MVPFLWFLALSFFCSFLNVAFEHKAPMEALAMGLAVGVIVTTMQFVVFPRLPRCFGRSRNPHA